MSAGGTWKGVKFRFLEYNEQRLEQRPKFELPTWQRLCDIHVPNERAYEGDQVHEGNLKNGGRRHKDRPQAAGQAIRIVKKAVDL
jgi:hypothetical protein